jgi:hypothetical protein
MMRNALGKAESGVSIPSGEGWALQGYSLITYFQPWTQATEFQTSGRIE